MQGDQRNLENAIRNANDQTQRFTIFDSLLTEEDIDTLEADKHYYPCKTIYKKPSTNKTEGKVRESSIIFYGKDGK
jgi:hypothetical protein